MRGLAPPRVTLNDRPTFDERYVRDADAYVRENLLSNARPGKTSHEYACAYASLVEYVCARALPF
jgi:hypothetical protein